MYRTLLLLSKLRFQGALRKLKRTLMTPKGALLTLFAVAFFSAMILPGLLIGRPPRADEHAPPVNLFIHPMALFALWLVTLTGSRMKSPLAFTLAEVEFLFPGPFTRRQLLVYKLLISTLGALGLVIMVPFAWKYLDVWWLAALLGIWWAVSFMQMSTILLFLAIDWLGQRFLWATMAVAGAVIAGVAASLWQAGVFDPDLALPDRLAALDASWPVEVLLAPFVVFNRMITAMTALSLLGWGAAALALNVAVVAGILQLDHRFLEASLHASQRRYDWIERVKRSGGVPALGARSKPRFTLPRLPRAGGVGPIAWRQMLHLLRGSGRLVFVVPALIGPGAALLASSRQGEAVSTGLVIFITVFIGFFVTMIMPLGLRTDLDHVDTIKTLPLSPTAIVWGSIASAIVYISLLQWVTALAMAALIGHWSLAITLTLVFTLPVNLLMIGSDSLLVLLFPTIRRFDPGDVLVGIRLMLVTLAKVIYVGLMLAIAMFYCFVVYAWIGEAPVALSLTLWLILVAEGIVSIWFAGLLFLKYDPSAHVAEQD